MKTLNCTVNLPVGLFKLGITDNLVLNLIKDRDLFLVHFHAFMLEIGYSSAEIEKKWEGFIKCSEFKELLAAEWVAFSVSEELQRVNSLLSDHLDQYFGELVDGSWSWELLYS